jgi:hypothetical protein
MTPAQAAQAAAQQNLAARSLVIANSVNMLIPVASGVITTGPGSVTNVNPRYFGLLKRFILKLTFDVTDTGGAGLTMGAFGPAAAIDNITMTDTANYLRHNTSATHMQLVATAKRRRVFGAAFTSDTPFGYGNNFQNVMSAPATIAAGQTGTVHMYIEVPVSYTDHDLRGAIWLAVTNATMTLSFRLNSNMFANTGTTDPTGALYVSGNATNATLGNVTWQLYQNCLDQVPRVQSGQGAGNPILPWQDIGTNYMLQTSPFNTPVANQDNPFPYPNFRDIMSTMAIFDNAGTLGTGGDVNTWSLQTANVVNMLQADPDTVALLTRNIIGDDVPPGMYYFDHRHQPIYTLQFGNLALLLNPSTSNAGASVTIGLEMLAIAGMITGAGSLAGSP